MCRSRLTRLPLYGFLAVETGPGPPAAEMSTFDNIRNRPLFKSMMFNQRRPDTH